MDFKIILFVCVVQIWGYHQKHCNSQNFLYESFKCKPVYTNHGHCPTSYDCFCIYEHDDMCYYNGKHYNVGESVDNSLTWEYCTGCTCDRDSSSNKTNFICYVADCARPPEIDEGCAYKYVLGQCCFSGIICPPFKECLIKGEVFSENIGKFRHPQDNCTKCVCERGDHDKGVLNCQKQYCNDLLFHQQEIKRKCAPLYNDVQYDCCPSQWICPENSITIGAEEGDNDGPTCFFGEQIIKKRQKFYIDHWLGKVVCECIIPPFPKCYISEPI